MKSRFGKIFKTLSVVAATSILATFGIYAFENKNIRGSLLGSLSDTTRNMPRCPEEMIFVSSSNGGFCVDKYEASPSNDCVYSDPQNRNETLSNIEKDNCYPVSRESVSPWRNISQSHAMRACAKAGKRLPTNKEWYQAALGTPDPGINESKASPCNISNEGKSGPRVSGEDARCISSSGTYDMVGNVWEWVEETVSDGVYEERNLPSEGFVHVVDSSGVAAETGKTADPGFGNDYFWIDKNGVKGMFRGGFWNSGSDGGYYSLHAGVSPSFIGNAVGFRCVK